MQTMVVQHHRCLLPCNHACSYLTCALPIRNITAPYMPWLLLAHQLNPILAVPHGRWASWATSGGVRRRT